MIGIHPKKKDKGVITIDETKDKDSCGVQRGSVTDNGNCISFNGGMGTGESYMDLYG